VVKLGGLIIQASGGEGREKGEHTAFLGHINGAFGFGGLVAEERGEAFEELEY
jgi:hypothetical protein